MGNRPCTGVLCYDVDPERSVEETSTKMIYNKNLPWRLKRALSDTIHTDDSIAIPENYKRRPSRQGDVKHITETTAGTPNIVRRKPLDRQHYSDLSNSTNDHATPYTYRCRTMSSETCGREARTEHNLSRRSSTTTCEREDMQDDILFHRSSEERI
jgi:hypothetical protein